VDVPAPIWSAAEPAWPALSADDLRRLRFFTYLRMTGRIRPPASIGPEADALCAALLREPPARRVPGSVPRNPYHGGLPPVWQAWAEKQKQRGAQAR
jgi:hypothetical protein